MLRLLIDENFSHPILRGIKRRLPSLDYVLARDVGLQGAADVELLLWAAQFNRVILTHDVETMTRDAHQLVASARQMAGVILVPQRLSIGAAIDDLEIVQGCMSHNDARDQITYLPL